MTIKQLADELGMSKQAIRKHVNRLPKNTVTTGDNRATLVSDKGANMVRESVATITTTPHTLVDTLQEQLQTKDRQIEALQKSLNDTTAALAEAQQTAKAAQVLHAETIQRQLPTGERHELSGFAAKVKFIFSGKL